MTGVITFNEAGRYILNWWVAAQSSQSVNGAVFAFSSSQNDFLEGNSPLKTGEVVGTGILEVVAAPVTAWLVNASTAEYYYSAYVPIKATLVIIQDDIGDTGPTGELGFNPFDVYVLVGSIGGDGTQANPFGTVQEGVAAVSPTGTVNVLG